MSRTYTTQIRLLLCQQCGAPLESAATGGAVACRYCHAQNQIKSRRDDQAAIPAPSMPVSEPERLARLRMQDGQPLVPPASLLPLVQGGSGGFHPAKVDEAFHVYQATRREVLTTSSPEAAERLYFLTLIANTHLTNTGDDARRRALLETSLETLSLPRHLQVVRALLATSAAKEGDLPSAEQWLAPCNPRSDDLEADSAFRVARAFLDTTRLEYAKVVAVLGSVDDGYPIADAWDPTAAVLRGNALERLGNLEAAVSSLRARMAKEGPGGRQTMERVIQAHPHLQLCAASFGHAQAGHTQVAAQAAAQGADGGIGGIFYFVGIAVCALGVLLMVGIGGPMVLAGLASGQSTFSALMEGGFTGGIICVSTMPLGLIFAVLGHSLRMNAKKAAWLRAHGIVCQGVVRGHQRTGTEINGVPVVQVEVEVRHPQHAPYTTTFKQLLSGQLARHLAPGSAVTLRVHPEKPAEVVVELS